MAVSGIMPVSAAFRASMRAVLTGAKPAGIDTACHTHGRNYLYRSSRNFGASSRVAYRSGGRPAHDASGKPRKRPGSMPWKTLAGLALLGIPVSKVALDVLPLHDVDTASYMPQWFAEQLQQSLGNTASERRVTSAEVASEGTGRLVRDVATALAIIQEYKEADPSPDADWSTVHQRSAERLLKLCQVRSISA